MLEILRRARSYETNTMRTTLIRVEMITRRRLTIPRPLLQYVYKYGQVTSFSFCRTLERRRKKLAKIVGDCGDRCGQQAKLY